jgi:hypothetical protein
VIEFADDRVVVSPDGTFAHVDGVKIMMEFLFKSPEQAEAKVAAWVPPPAARRPYHSWQFRSMEVGESKLVDPQDAVAARNAANSYRLRIRKRGERFAYILMKLPNGQFKLIRTA